MAANFEELCSFVCELIGVQTPELSRDADGVIAFTVDRGHGEISILERRDLPGVVMVLTNLDPVDEKDDHRACRVLMEVNFLMLGRPDSPGLARNPVTGEFVLHYARKLEDVSGMELYEAIARMEEVWRNWQGGAVLREDSAAHRVTNPRPDLV